MPATPFLLPDLLCRKGEQSSLTGVSLVGVRSPNLLCFKGFLKSFLLYSSCFPEGLSWPLGTSCNDFFDEGGGTGGKARPFCPRGGRGGGGGHFRYPETINNTLITCSHKRNQKASLNGKKMRNYMECSTFTCLLIRAKFKYFVNLLQFLKNLPIILLKQMSVTVFMLCSPKVDLAPRRSCAKSLLK